MEPLGYPECISCVQRAVPVGEDGNARPIRDPDADIGLLVPLSDYGGQGAAVQFKAWVCTNPDCAFNLKIRNGEIHRNEPILDGPGGNGK